MGKKKRHNQNSNNPCNLADSSESESSKDSLQASEANSKTNNCPHILKSLDIAALRKKIKNCKDINTRSNCSLCKKSDSDICKDIWVCLRCGGFNCGPDEENHRIDHYKTLRSDTHYLAFQVNTSVIWCFKCDIEIQMEAHKKIRSCTEIIKKHFFEQVPFSPVKVETDTTKMNGDCSTNYSTTEMTSCQPLKNVCLNKEVMQPVLSLPKVRGLINLGNTCFFNSVLQCLAQTPGLVELLREIDIPGERFNIEVDGVTIDTVLEKPKSCVLSEQLAQILTEVSGVTSMGDGKTGHYGVNPRRLLDALTQNCPQFEGGDQHDAHELLRHLLDSVHMEDLKRYQKAILAHIGYKKKDEVDGEKLTFINKVNRKVCDTIPIRPDQIFKGSLVSILECTVCGHISKRDEPFLDLSLPVVQEKAQPPVRRKQNCSSPVEEKQNTEVTLSKHQQKVEKRAARRNRKIRNGNEKDQAQGEPTIKEEDKKDSNVGEQSDADVEDNEDNVCEEQDNKTEVVESGYSSEKQMSARGSPITTQSPEENPKNDNVQENLIFLGCEPNPAYTKSMNEGYSSITNTSKDSGTSLTQTNESGLGSVQELTVTIPDEMVINIECTSQDSVRVNASNGSPDISSDSQHGQFKTVDLTSCDYKLLPNSESQVNRTEMIYNWNCTGDMMTQSQESSSVSLSVSPQCGSLSSQDNINNVSPKCSPKDSPLSGSHSNENMSVCTSLPPSNDNMSVCNSLPETSVVLNSPIKSQNSLQEQHSESEERPESRMECQKSRSSPVDPGEVAGMSTLLTQLKFVMEEKMYSENERNTDGGEEITQLPTEDRLLCTSAEQVVNTDVQSDSALVGGEALNKTPIPLPPPLPSFSSPYTFSHPEPAPQRFNHISSFSKHKFEEGEVSLQSCLGQFTTIEMLAGGNKVGCEACTERINKGNKEGKTVYQNSTKQLLISRLPPVVIFHLKRFQVQRCSFRKISRHIDFPLVLDISPFCLNENNSDSEKVLYSLFGVVEHSGTLHGGHYVAYVKVRSHNERRAGTSPPGKWYYVSDSRVSDVDESSVLKTQAYLLFYERII